MDELTQTIHTGENIDMADFEDMWEMQRAVVKRRENVEKFCDTCAALSARDRRKVQRFLERHASGKAGAKADAQWTKNDTRACYTELRTISPKVATAWRRWALERLELAQSEYCYRRLAFRVLADSLECRMWLEYSSGYSF